MHFIFEKAIKLLKQLTPAFIITQIIQVVLSLPPMIAKPFAYILTAPTESQREWIKYVDHGTWRGAWIGACMNQCDGKYELLQRIKDADLIIYKAHGGAFRVGHCTMYMDVFIYWIENLKRKYNINALILSIEYGLAPEHKYPSPMIECTEAYQYLLYTLKVPGSKIILSGDSAGATLCLGALIRTYTPDLFNNIDTCRTDYSVELPAGLLLVSPLLSLNLHEWLWHFKSDLVTPALARTVVKEFLDIKSNKGRNTLPFLKVVNIKSGFSRFVPNNIMLIVGEQEVMRDDILSLAKTVMREEKRIRIQIHRENFGHDWYFLREIVKSSQQHIIKKTDDDFIDFVAKALTKRNNTERVSTLQPIVQGSHITSFKQENASVTISAIA
ncbi:alpha/beta-hydrolase, partial [Backusella circina FSU 941]